MGYPNLHQINISFVLIKELEPCTSMLGEVERGVHQTMLFCWTLPCWEQEWLPGGCRQDRGLGSALTGSPGTNPLPLGTGGALDRELTQNSFPSPSPCCSSTAVCCQVSPLQVMFLPPCFHRTTELFGLDALQPMDGLVSRVQDL